MDDLWVPPILGHLHIYKAIFGEDWRFRERNVVGGGVMVDVLGMDLLQLFGNVFIGDRKQHNSVLGWR